MFHAIATHEWPHLDEIAAIWLLRRFGEKQFPGIATAEIVYWTTGGVTPDGRPASEYEREGVLVIGTGGGRFDEHPNADANRKEGECAATLVAKALGLENDPVLEQILKYVRNNDLKGSGHAFDIAHLSRLLFSQNPENPDLVIKWVIDGLEAKFVEQFQFWGVTKKAFEENAMVEEIPGPSGRMLKLAIVESDDGNIGKFARFSRGGGVDIVVQRRSTGHTQIFTRQASGLTLYDVAQILRLEEQEAKGEIVTSDWNELSSDGKVAGAEEWYFQMAGQMLLNGSLTAKGVLPTRIALETIVKIVKVGVNPGAFEQSCSGDACASNRHKQCPWYCVGLRRCRAIRHTQAPATR